MLPEAGDVNGQPKRKFPDGTVIWTAPTGQKYVTHPGNALLFPGLCAPPHRCPGSLDPPIGAVRRPHLPQGTNPAATLLEVEQA